MTDQSRTPRTDALIAMRNLRWDQMVDFARTLELEAADLRERLAALTAALENKAIMEAKRPEPVAWLVQYRDRHEFTFKKPAFLIDAVAEPLYGPDLLDYADRMRTYWQAIDHRMVVLHLGTADSFDADTCMNKILEWETQIALDPSVSRQAEELRDTHKERAETAERQLAAMEKVITAEDAEIVRDVQRLERQLAELQAKHDALVKRLREPTQEMQTAGVDATEFTFSCKRQVRDAFRAMSAVALDKGEE